jgi:hypothetical protein
MIQLSEQQISELKIRSEAVSRQTASPVFAQIDALVTHAASERQISNEHIALLNNLLNAVGKDIIEDESNERAGNEDDERTEVQNIWENAQLESKHLQDRHAHLLLSHRETMRNVESFKRYLVTIMLARKTQILSRERF